MDDSISINQLLDAAKKLGDSSVIDKLTSYRDNLGLTGESVVKFGEINSIVGEKVSKSLHEIVQSAMDLINKFPLLSEAAQKTSEILQSTFNKFIDTINATGITFSDTIVFFEPLAGIIDKSVTGIGKLGDAGNEAGYKIISAFKSIEPVWDSAFKDSPKTKRFFSAIVEGTDSAIGLQRELLAMSVAQGRASDTFDITTHKLKDVNKLYNEFANTSQKAAIATGQSVGSIMDLERALYSIPGSMDSAEETIKASRLAAAEGKNQLDVAKQLVEMYTRLGTSESSALEEMAYIYEKAGDSKLRMEAFNQTVMNIASNFKMLGDNTLAATNFVSAFDKVFEGSNISPEAMKEVITGIGQGIERMGIAKEAFISSNTGGPGGLAGSFQIEYALQTGHMDEVVQKTMMAMQSQFGGQILTLKDAAQNPALAGEFYKQVQYLTQVSGIAKDDRDAYRILEAMKGGVLDILKPGAAEGEKDIALSRQLDRGLEIQDQTKHGVAGTFINTLQMAEMMRLKQNQDYKSTMSLSIDDFYSKTGIDIGNILGGFGINIKERDTSRDDEAAKRAGVSMLAHNKPGEIGNYANIEPKWSEMLGGSFGIDSMIEESDAGVHRFLSGLSDKKTTQNRDEQITNTKKIPTYKDLGFQTTNRPPPGTETGISHIMPGHKPTASELGLPESPRVTLPKLKTDDTRTSEIPPLNINHTFEPIQIDITGIGDQAISKIVDLKIKHEQERDIGQRGLGR